MYAPQTFASESPCAFTREAAQAPMPGRAEALPSELSTGVDGGGQPTLPAQGRSPAACAGGVHCEMISRHKENELQAWQQTQRLAAGDVIDSGSRMIVVSWLIEVAEDFGLAQETLHAAVALLDRFLATSPQVRGATAAANARQTPAQPQPHCSLPWLAGRAAVRAAAGGCCLHVRGSKAAGGARCQLQQLPGSAGAVLTQARQQR